MSDIIGTIFGKTSKEKSSSTSSNSSTSTSGNLAFPFLSQALAPAAGYVQQGGNAFADLLGLRPQGSSATNTTPTSTPTPTPGVYNPSPTATPAYDNYSYPGSNTYQNVTRDGTYDVDNEQGPIGDRGDGALGMLYQRRQARQDQFNQADNPVTSPGPVGTETGTPLPGVTPTGGSSGGGQGSALDNFANSAGMGFIRDQGVKAIEGSQAGKGMLQSGATGKALQAYGQNLGKTYLNDYLGHLLDYANLGNNTAKTIGAAGAYSNSQSEGTGVSNSSGTGGKQGLVQTLLSDFRFGGGGG